ncbi:rhomboid family intramembrane serine protease [Anaerobacillus isosaccharinicus]|uniref:Rhomboid family intramembrane serine protease n=1 Tax=Anaerobacillus isosaccharinicus TaxID=1532552 RepID=A0A1S2KXG2_9BACI|nr:rhomboid family intramembrane serine protease [Anaerobacillus isosaccharinicus]MBA5586830.1 rhomboid family intramembrane serine protease [Anaerobacillus isosaccharinicus]QOY34957.1 rhomboid family intramembrane serine protease [Anaerobacillus isosaccharinicus]
MVFLYVFLSVFGSVLLAVIFGIPVVSASGISFFPYEYFILGLTSSVGYYYFVYTKEKAFNKQHILTGFSFGILALLTVMLIQYMVIKKLFGETISALMYVNIFRYEILVFLIGSIVLPLFKIGGQIKCKACKRGYFTEELLFEVNQDYQHDVKRFIQLADNANQSELSDFIIERRLSTGFNSKIKGEETSQHSFYLLTCTNCHSQYISRGKQRDINDDDSNQSYKIVTKIHLNEKLLCNKQ